MTGKDKGNFDFELHREQQELIAQLIRDGKLEVKKVNQYLDLKVDFSTLFKERNLVIENFHDQEDMFSENVLFMKDIQALPSYLISKSEVSFMAPGYHLNQYLEMLNEFTLNDFEKNDNTETELILNIYVQSLFSSVKALIDRLLPVFTFYYPGLSVNSTFGRIKESGKASGLMSKVVELETDSTMQYVRENYENWIKGIVSPRDMLAHYNDFSTRYQYPIDGRVFPVHLEIKVFNDVKVPKATKDIDDLESMFPNDHTYKTLSHTVYRAYEFYLNTLRELSKKEIKFSKQHFRNESAYNLYLESIN